jgi:hypothetical protein
LAGRKYRPSVKLVYTLQQTLIAMPLLLWLLLLMAALHHQVASLRVFRKLRMLKRLPVLSCDVLPRVRRIGAVIAVEVQTSPEIIRAPLSGKDCGWYLETVTEHVHRENGDPATRLADEIGQSLIEVGDDTGSIFVTPRLGQRRLVRRGRRLVTKSAKNTTPCGSRTRDIYGNKITGYTRRERIAPADTRVVVIGAIAWTADGSILLDRVRGWSGTFVGSMAELSQHLQAPPARAARLVRSLTIICVASTVLCVPVVIWLQTLLNHQ